MWYTRNKSQKKWQKGFIKDVLSKKQNNKDTFLKIVTKDTSFLEQKEAHFPATFCKYYAPTSDNILDVQQQRIGLAHPSSFNDPFDCSIGCDVKEYEKQCLLKFIKENEFIDTSSYEEGFTSDEYNRIYNSTTNSELTYHYLSKLEDYWNVMWDLLKKKSKPFDHKIYEFRREARKEAETKIEKLRNINIRVACFSEFKRHNGFSKNIQMWSHYADNHKGFCVEFDLSFLKEKTEYTVDDYQYYSEPDQYINERLKATIKGCLFPVIYTSSRTNIPVTKLMKLKIDEIKNHNHNRDIDMLLFKAFIIKSANWSYEKEWRLILEGEISTYFDNKLPFPYIKKIYLGCKMDHQTRATMIDIAKELNVDVVDLSMDNKKFILEEQDISIIDLQKENKRWINPFA